MHIGALFRVGAIAASLVTILAIGPAQSGEKSDAAKRMLGASAPRDAASSSNTAKPNIPEGDPVAKEILEEKPDVVQVPASEKEKRPAR